MFYNTYFFFKKLLSFPQAIYNWWVYKEELKQTSPYTAEFHLMS